ncbi:MAG: Crp/Fnr family transcriptional regulator [Sediminibacterium sp.]|jgi:CRP-like cAMP-binding protein|nr:Crp/Fnr family transcriptional regulator [Sediminibacterium sp.]
MTETTFIYKNFFEYIDNIIPLTGDERDIFLRKILIMKYKKGEIIIHQGIKSNYIFYIHKGIVRYYINNNNKTCNFRSEGMTVTGYSTYNYDQGFKSKTNVECLEDCTFVLIPVDTMHYVMENFKYGDRLGRFLAEKHILELVDVIIDRDCKPVIERYNDLNVKFQNIHQRVAQHFIASFLGTTPVHLSRLKSKDNANKMIATV